jgi:flagellar motor switch protein FliG
MDEDILAKVAALVSEEKALAVDTETSAERQAHRARVEQQLDQCWDLLRQRQALREFGKDPAEAQARPIPEVEQYLQ